MDSFMYYILSFCDRFLLIAAMGCFVVHFINNCFVMSLSVACDDDGGNFKFQDNVAWI